MEYKLKECVLLTKQGDDIAAEKLLFYLKPLILSTIRKYARNQLDKEELLQEGYLEVLRLTHDYDQNKNVPYLAYIKKYLKYFFLNYIRGEIIVYDSLNRQVNIGNEKVELLELIQDKDSDIEEYYELKEEYQSLLYAISQLSLKQQKVILLHYFHEKPLKQIAEDLGIHYMSIVKLKKRAELRLACLMKSK